MFLVHLKELFLFLVANSNSSFYGGWSLSPSHHTSKDDNDYKRPQRPFKNDSFANRGF